MFGESSVQGGVLRLPIRAFHHPNIEKPTRSLSSAQEGEGWKQPQCG